MNRLHSQHPNQARLFRCRRSQGAVATEQQRWKLPAGGAEPPNALPLQQILLRLAVCLSQSQSPRFAVSSGKRSRRRQSSPKHFPQIHSTSRKPFPLLLNLTRREYDTENKKNFLKTFKTIKIHNNLIYSSRNLLGQIVFCFVLEISNIWCVYVIDSKELSQWLMQGNKMKWIKYQYITRSY